MRHVQELVEEGFGRDVPDASCVFCSSEITVPYYHDEEIPGYGESSIVYSHKLCMEIPEQVEHEQHPGHTLQVGHVRDNETSSVCNVCGESERCDFIYNCFDCSEFSLDMVCALKSRPITHACHPQHPLIPKHDKLEEFLCAACKTVSKGISYKCLTCSFHVHQRCVAPRTIKAPYHRHNLKLIYSIPQSRVDRLRSVYCQRCQEDIEEQSLAYHCARCGYFYHTHDCRYFEHPGHGHALFSVDEDNEEEIYPYAAFRPCHGCGLKISAPYYCCNDDTYRECKMFFLHKSCAELPITAENHLHPGHALALSETKESIMCNACHAPWEGVIMYCCYEDNCRFNLDIVCAMKTMQSTYDFHQQHPLISSHTKASFPCHACNQDTDGASYQCTICRFWVHQKCASLLGSKKYDFHPHKLELTYLLSESHPSRKRFRCHACRKDMQPDSWAYHCAGCKYFTHVHNCKDPFREIEGFDHEKALEAAAHLPVANEFVSLATLFFMDTNEEEDKTSEPVSQDGRGKTWQMPFIDLTEPHFKYEKLLEAPCKNCDRCKFLLPKSPAEVQPQIGAYYWPYAVGKDCHRRFVLYRDEDDFLLMHLGSAVLPCFVKHEGHIHVLSTTSITHKTWCNACEKDFEKGYGFRCNICDFTLDMYCAMLPGSVSHQYDKEHGFKLTYYSIVGVEEYICEICEGDITTMWFYHCAECDQSIHPRCIWKNYVEYHAYGYDIPLYR